MPSKIEPIDLITDLQKVASKLGRTPLVTEYERLGQYTPPTFRKNFGSWANALAAANLVFTKNHRRFYTDADIENTITTLTQQFGHPPSYTEIKKYSNISPDTFMRRIGKTGFGDPTKPPLDPDWSVDAISDAEGYWISGLVTGEGSFTINKTGGTSFKLGLRVDDIEIIRHVKSVLDLPQNVGTYSNQYRRDKGQVVGDEARLNCANRWVNKLRIIPFFDRFPLRGRKQLDYKLFKECVEFMTQRDLDNRYHKRLDEHEKSFIEKVYRDLQALRTCPLS